MALVVIAEGTHLEDLAYHGDVAEGVLRIYMDRSVSEEEVAAIEERLVANGVQLTEPVLYEAGFLVISYRDVPTGQIGFLPALAIIAGIGIVGVIGWQLYAEAAKQVLIVAAVVAAVVALVWVVPRVRGT